MRRSSTDPPGWPAVGNTQAWGQSFSTLAAPLLLQSGVVRLTTHIPKRVQRLLSFTPRQFFLTEQIVVRSQLRYSHIRLRMRFYPTRHISCGAYSFL